MANTKSAKKAIRVTERKTQINKARKSRIKTFIRKVTDAVKENNLQKAKEAFKNLEPELMRGVTKGVYKLKTASRKLRVISSLIKKINTSSEEQESKTAKA